MKVIRCSLVSIGSLLSLFVLITACRPIEVADSFSGSLGSARVVAASNFTLRQQVGTITDLSLDEISGLAVSRTNTSGGPFMWVEEDSNNPNKIYLVTESGTIRATYTLPATDKNGRSVNTDDWEDIAVGPGPTASTWYIYLADIGDNSASRNSINIYRILEPSIAGKGDNYKVNLPSSSVEQIKCQYADGARNAETLMIHAQTKDLYIISKEDATSKESTKYSVKGGIYRVPYPQSTSTTNQLTRSGSIGVSTATAGDISFDGNEILVQNYERVFTWKRTNTNQSISQVLLSTYSNPPYVANQNNGATENSGEAIGWKTDGSGFYTISELKGGRNIPIYYYKKQ